MTPTSLLSARELQWVVLAEYADMWASGDWWGALFGPYVDLLSWLGLGLFITSVFIAGLYSWSEDITLPLTVIAMFSGVVITNLPGAAVTPIRTLFTIAVAAGIIGIWRVLR